MIVGRRLADRRRAADRPATGEEPAAPERLAPDPAAAAVEAETGLRFEEAFRGAWSALTEREALVLLFKFRDGLPQTEIARVLGVGEPRVSRMISGASEKIRMAVLRRIGSGAGAEEPDAGPAWEALSRAVAGFLATLPRSSDPSASG